MRFTLLKACLSLRNNLIVTCLFFIFFTPVSAWLDLKVSHHFYQAGHFQTSLFLEWIYHYGIIPGWFLVGYAFFGLLISFFKKYYVTRQKDFIVIILTLALGSGLVAHLLLKDHWGRPRPRQTIEFGGSQAFHAFYQPQFFEQPQPSKSFVCGHCTMGFCFFSLFFLGIYYQKKMMALIGLLSALLLGGMLGYARIAQGGHFLSDVIISAFIMWWTALLLTQAFFSNYLLLKNDVENDEKLVQR